VGTGVEQFHPVELNVPLVMETSTALTLQVVVSFAQHLVPVASGMASTLTLSQQVGTTTEQSSFISFLQVSPFSKLTV
jgi:hypothetical protein